MALYRTRSRVKPKPRRPVNRDKTHQWKADIVDSVDMYNDWFMRFAPQAFRTTRVQTTKDVEAALRATDNITNIQPTLMRKHPEILPTLRMSTCPPLAVDRLIGLAGVSINLVKCMELEKKLPVRMKAAEVDLHLAKIAKIIEKMADPDIFVWLGRKQPPSERRSTAPRPSSRIVSAGPSPIRSFATRRRNASSPPSNSGSKRAATTSFPPVTTVCTSRLCRPAPSAFGPMSRSSWKAARTPSIFPLTRLSCPKRARSGDFPVFFEAKSAGDFTNTNKRRKEEVVKTDQLRRTYGNKVQFNLFLCGYFDSGYLGYEAAEGIDWVWEHRIDDLALFGL